MKKLTLSALVVVTSLAAASGALAQDAAAGKTSFNKCLACHAIGEGAKNKVGPELNGLDGRKSGTAAGLQLFRRQQEFRHHLEQGPVPRIHQGPEGQDSRHQDGVRRHQERERGQQSLGLCLVSSTRTGSRNKGLTFFAPAPERRVHDHPLKPACVRSPDRPARSPDRSVAAPDRARSTPARACWIPRRPQNC